MAFDNLLGYILTISMIMRIFTKKFHVSWTYVTHEIMMSYVRTYVTHKKMMFVVQNDVTYENVICPNLCYIRKCLMSKSMLHENIRCDLSELMLNTKM